MNRYKLLKEFYDLTAHNLHCYSADGLMKKAKDGFEESWFREKEKLELIEELIEDERQSKFKIHHSIQSLKEITDNKELAYLEDRKNGVSCYLESFNEDGKIEYNLVFSIHKKDAFDDEFDNVYIKEIDAKFLNSRNTLKNKMEKELAKFNKFKTKYNVYKFYEDNEAYEKISNMLSKIEVSAVDKLKNNEIEFEDELIFENNTVNAYIPLYNIDIFKKFNICKRENFEYNMYLLYDFIKDESVISIIEKSDEKEVEYQYKPSVIENQMLKEKLQEYCQKNYNLAIEELNEEEFE